MEVNLERAETVEPQALSLDRAGSNPSRPRSSFDPSTNKGSDASASGPRVARDQAGCASGSISRLVCLLTLQARSIGPARYTEPRDGRETMRVNGYSGSHRRSGGPTLDDISADLILGDLVQAHVGIAMLRQPALGRFVALG